MENWKFLYHWWEWRHCTCYPWMNPVINVFSAYKRQKMAQIFHILNKNWFFSLFEIVEQSTQPDLVNSIVHQFYFKHSSFPVNTRSWHCCYFCFSHAVRSKIISLKKIPPVGIEPGILGCWDLLCVQAHAFLTELTSQVLIEGYLTSLLLVYQLTFGLR